MAGPSSETNLQTYNKPEVASHYAALECLTPCERLLFGSFIKPGGVILDLGVGGGRATTSGVERAYLAMNILNPATASLRIGTITYSPSVDDRVS